MGYQPKADVPIRRQPGWEDAPEQWRQPDLEDRGRVRAAPIRVACADRRSDGGNGLESAREFPIGAHHEDPRGERRVSVELQALRRYTEM